MHLYGEAARFFFFPPKPHWSRCPHMVKPLGCNKKQRQPTIERGRLDTDLAEGLYDIDLSGRLHCGCCFLRFLLICVCCFQGNRFPVNLRLFTQFSLTEGRPPGQRPSLSHAAFRQKKTCNSTHSHIAP